jgi:hypothetical protein
MVIGYRRARVGGLWNLYVRAHTVPAHYSLKDQFYRRKELSMDISVSKEVQEQLDQIKEWMESKIGREITYNDVMIEILKNFQNVLHPEDLGSA